MNLLTEGIESGIAIKTELSRKITIDGLTAAYPVYKVKLDYLYFNDQNDRIATWISQYKADNNISKLDTSDVNKYNDIIHDFIVKSNPEAIKKTQTNIELVDQREPGVVLFDGRIIDGNRRFTCLRNLAEDNVRFNYFETVILDKSIQSNAKEIKMLELMLQHGEESKVDYNPIDRLVGVYNDIIENNLLTSKEYSRGTNLPESEVIKQIELAKLLVEFLETINAPKQFYIARDLDLNGPLNELYGILKKQFDEEKRSDIKNVVFTNLLMQPEGDMTRFIRKMKTIISDPAHSDDFLEEQLEISEEVLDKLPEEGKMSRKIINEEFRSNVEVKEKLERSLNKADFKAKSTESRNKPLKTLQKAGDLLEAIDTIIINKLNEEQITSIITEIDRIEELLDAIRDTTNV